MKKTIIGIILWLVIFNIGQSYFFDNLKTYQEGFISGLLFYLPLLILFMNLSYQSSKEHVDAMSAIDDKYHKITVDIYVDHIKSLNEAIDDYRKLLALKEKPND